MNASIWVGETNWHESLSRHETSYTTTQFLTDGALIDEYKKDCDLVRKGVKSDIEKCLIEGKSLIIEGFHIDPRLYQKDFDNETKKGNVNGIIVPFLLTLDEKNHREFMANSPDPRYRTKTACTSGFCNLQVVQSYLEEHNSNSDQDSFINIPINIHSFQETLDSIHDIVLKRIKMVYG